jgi:hypothetical protein
MQRANQLQKNTVFGNRHVGALPATLLLLLFLALAPSARSASDSVLPGSVFPAEYAQLEFDEFASVKALEELMEERRYKVEIIVFTRADQSGLREEPLLSIEPRVLPKNMFALSPNIDTRSKFNTASNDYCIGYPNIATEPELPAKLRALLNKENEPELAQWFSDAGLDTNPQDLKPLLDGNFAAEGLPLETSTPSEQFVELAIPTSAPRVLPTPYLNFITQLSFFARSLKDNSYGLIGREQFELNNEALILDRNPKFNLLLHQSWQQVVPPRAAPQQIYFAAKDSTNSLEGMISVTLGRYLHFAGQLWLDAPVADYEAEQLLRVSEATEVDLQSKSAQRQFKTAFLEATTTAKSADALTTLENANSTNLANIPKSAYFELNESRRMRSRELHYLDHPFMGIIVKITPIEATEPLLQAWADYDEYRAPSRQPSE